MWWRFITFCVLVSIVLFVVLSCIQGRPAIHLFFHRCCEDDIENDQVIFENFGNNFLRERLVGGDIVSADNSSLVSDDDVQEVIELIRKKMNVHDPRSREKTSEEVLTLNDDDYTASENENVKITANTNKAIVINNDNNNESESKVASDESYKNGNREDGSYESDIKIILDPYQTKQITIPKNDELFEEKDSVFSERTKVEMEEEFDVTMSDSENDPNVSEETTASAKIDALTDEVSEFDESREHTTESVRVRTVNVRQRR